ncbi:ankyrin repeat-containing domain protein [Chytridium lagenaria]|nr:ankyrin repeat-containing domain protein [Chytridium lagenaria]
MRVYSKMPDGWSALSLAARYGNLKVVEYILKNRRDIFIDLDGMHGSGRNVRTPLEWAAGGGHLGVCIALFNAGATSPGALIAACKHNMSEVCWFLLTAGWEPSWFPDEWCSVKPWDFDGENEKDPFDEGMTALHWAACRGNSEVCRMLLDQSLMWIPPALWMDELHWEVSIDTSDAKGFSALHFSAISNKASITALLLEKGLNTLNMAAMKNASDVIRLVAPGMDMSKKTSSGLTPLSMAIYKQNLDSITALIECGAGIENIDPDEMTAAGLCASQGFLEALECIVKLRPDLLELRDVENVTSLIIACENGNEEVCERLIALGASVDCMENVGKEKRGGTPLLAAVTQGHSRVVELLLEHGAKADALFHRVPPLCRAARLGFSEVCGVLIRYGCALDDRVGSLTALQTAASQNHADAVTVIERAMIEAGFGLELQDSDGNTALALAAYYGKENAVSVLVGMGSSKDAKMVVE